MNVVFLGSSHFGLRCLKVCIGSPECQVAGVLTVPESFRISYQPAGVNNVLHADVAGFAQSHSIAVRVIQDSMNESGLLDAVAAWKPNVFVVAGWYHMMPKTWRELAPAYGLHASLLPDYSGGAPLVWAMINGETKTGITLFQMAEGVDSGPIAGQREEPIRSDDTIATLYARIEEHGIALLHEVLPQLANGTLRLRVQDESQRRFFPQRSPEDGLINWSQDAAVIDRFIRAQTRPYPGAFSTFDGKALYIWRASVVATASASAQPGVVCFNVTDCSYVVHCASSAIRLDEISYEKKTYSESHLARLFGGGGQQLGVSPSCLKNSALC